MRGVVQTRCLGARNVEIFFLKGNPMFQLDSYLFFDGTCADAMPLADTFWSEALGTPWMLSGSVAKNMA